MITVSNIEGGGGLTIVAARVPLVAASPNISTFNSYLSFSKPSHNVI